MSKRKFLISLLLAISVLMSEAGGVLAAPALQAFPPISGMVQSITVETDATTGLTTVLVTLTVDGQTFQTVRVSQKSAEKLGLVVPDDDGKPAINKSALGQPIEIKLSAIIPDEGDRHPVGDALATFFSERLQIEHEALYDAIMAAHEKGSESGNSLGFGTIAQVLWLTTKMQGDADLFKALLLAKETGDFRSIILDDGTTPENWTQLRKAVVDGKKMGNLGGVISNNNNGNGNNKEKNNNKDKDKSNNGRGNGNNR
jgi:hypothetical protein